MKIQKYRDVPNLVIKRYIPEGSAIENKNLISEAACDLLVQGKTFKQIAEAIGVSTQTIYWLRRKYPHIVEEMERAAFEGSTAILEELRDTPFNEPDAARARVKIEALKTYLELRWPERFGKRIDVTVKTLDLGDALSKARQRAGLTIESTAYAVLATDDKSVSDDDGSVDELI